MSSSEIDVQVNQGILWVGSEAYPLQNIARVQPVKVVPNRGAACRVFAIRIVLCVLLIAGATVAAKFASRTSSAEVYNVLHDVANGAFALAAVVAAISIILLVIRLSRRTAYALVIETAGTPRTALVTYDQALVLRLVQRITAAINNPQQNWQEHVTVINNNHNIYAPNAKGMQVGGQGNVFNGNIY
jgi:hypothetical protein